MSSLESLPPAEQAQQLIEDPSLWEQLVEIHGSPQMTYNHLRNKAGTTLNFDEFLDLLSICIEYGGDSIRETVEDRLPRSIKNQLLRGSPRGRAYPIETLADVSQRLAAYDQLNVDVPSLYEEVTVIVEHLHDMDLDSHPKALHLRLLLSELPQGDEQPDDLTRSIAFIARYWLVLETTGQTLLKTIRL